MKVKCQICGKKIDREDAYRVEHVTKSGSKSNKYYCNEEEYEEFEKEKELFKQCQYSTDSILGYPICNNVRNKMLSELHEIYSYETIYECIEFYKQEIIKSIEIKGDFGNEYNKISYMFAVIKGNIKDFSIANKTKVNKSKEIKEEEIEVYEEEVKPVTRPIRKRKSLQDRLRG